MFSFQQFNPHHHPPHAPPPPSWMVLLLGILIGQTGTRSSSSWIWLQERFETVLVPVYTLLVLLYLGGVAYRQRIGPLLFPPKEKKEVAAVLVEPVLEDQEPQPFDLSGVYKLISNDNFEGFLEVQGVSWALRRAANQARPTHRITHVGRKLTIKIEGIIESQTTYIINGPPVETNVRGRIFEDQVQYLDSGKGILVSKRAITEDYDVTVQRDLSDDRQEITMTSTAMFRDGKAPVQCIQKFQRIE